MKEEKEIKISGYEIMYQNDKTSNSGGIVVTVEDTMKIITMQVKEETEVGQTLWLLLNNQKKKRKVGVIYAPQEEVTPNKNLRNCMYQ